MAVSPRAPPGWVLGSLLSFQTPQPPCIGVRCGNNAPSPLERCPLAPAPSHGLRAQPGRWELALPQGLRSRVPGMTRGAHIHGGSRGDTPGVVWGTDLCSGPETAQVAPGLGPVATAAAWEFPQLPPPSVGGWNSEAVTVGTGQPARRRLSVASLPQSQVPREPWGRTRQGGLSGGTHPHHWRLSTPIPWEPAPPPAHCRLPSWTKGCT